MRRTICLLLLLAPFVLIKAQDNKRDSLLKLLPSSKQDTARVMLLLDIADTYETNNQDSSVYYLEKSKQLSESLGFSKGLYQYYHQSAVVSFTKGDYTTAVDQNNKGLSLARILKDSSKVIAILNNMAIVSAYQGDFESQLTYTLQVKDAVEAIKDSGRLAAVYHGVANVWNNLKQYRRAVDFALLSVRIHTEFNKKNAYINRVYAALGQNYEELDMGDSALYFYNMAIEESVKLNDKYAQGIIYSYICDYYEARNQFGEMLKASEKALVLSRELQSRQMEANSLYNVAYANFYNGNNVIARKYIGEALEIASKDSLLEESMYSYLILSYIAARDGDFTTSSWAKHKTDSIREKILNEQIIKTTSEIEKKYETAKKDKQIVIQQSQLQKREIVNYILLGSAVVLLTLSLLAYRNFNQKKKLQQQRIIELETEKKLTATEAVLKGEEQERTRLAKDLHDGLGGMLSGIKYSFQTMKGNLVMTPDNQQAFERSMDMLDSSIKEMRRVAHNMMPEALVKFGLDTALKDFCNDIHQSGALKLNYQSFGLGDAVIDQTIAITIYRIVQELLNNTMKHAAAKSAIVQVSKIDGRLSVTVEDDGKGFDTSILNQSKGIGWSNIQHRIEFLKGKLDVNSQKEKGTSVLIELPV